MSKLELAGDDMPDDVEDGEEQDSSQEEMDQIPPTPELDAALHDAYIAYLNAWKEAITSTIPTVTDVVQTPP